MTNSLDDSIHTEHDKVKNYSTMIMCDWGPKGSNSRQLYEPCKFKEVLTHKDLFYHCDCVIKRIHFLLNSNKLFLIIFVDIVFL